MPNPTLYLNSMAIRVAYINFWSDDRNERWLSHFIALNIGEVEHVAPSEDPDILIASVFGPLEVARNTKAKRKLFYYGENLNRFSEYSDFAVLKEVFDLVVGFKPTDVAQKLVRFPLWLLSYPFYTFSEKRNVLTHIDEQRRINRAKPKEFLGSCVATHDMFGQRTVLYEATKAYGEFKCPSGFIQNAPPIGPTLEDKISFIAKGFYNICAENSPFEGYCTEKIFHALEAGTIPIYWSQDLPEPELLEPAAYCYVNVNEPADVAAKIQHCMVNKERYLDAPIFTPQAVHLVSNYYQTLITQIKRGLGLLPTESVHGLSYASRQFAGRRAAIEDEAFQSAYFESFTCATEGDVDEAFKARHAQIWAQAPGGGYWIWKPHIIRKHLGELSEQDVMLYVDSGCSFCTTDRARERFASYVQMVRNHWSGLLRFQLDHPEEKFTNRHMIDFVQEKLGRNMGPSTQTKQLVGGILLVRKTSFSLAFFDTLLEILEADSNLITDVYTRPDEVHRHDQSLSSLVYKALGGSLIVPDETYFEEGFGSDVSLRYPIWATRSGS
jgi:hypothetical protein